MWFRCCIKLSQSAGEESDIFGLVGLGFDGPNGTIPSALTNAGFNGTEIGKSVLTSIYDQDVTKGQFFSLSLSRFGDVEDTADASLVINGFDDKYASVQFAPLLPQFPVNSGAWGRDLCWGYSYSVDFI
jgi:hypothetical protein